MSSTTPRPGSAADGAAWLYPMAATLARHGRLREAEQWLETLLATGPSADAYCLLGKVQAQSGDRERATESFAAALGIDPHHVASASALACVRGLAAPASAVALGRWRGAAIAAGAVACISLALLASRPSHPRATGGGGDTRALEDLRARVEHVAALQERLANQAPTAPAAPTAPKSVANVELMSTYADLVQAVRGERAFRDVTMTPRVVDGKVIAMASGQVPSSFVRDRLSAVGAAHGDAIDVRDVVISYQYTVQPGDSLESIAKRVYGWPTEWSALWSDNRDVLNRADHLRPMTVLKLR